MTQTKKYCPRCGALIHSGDVYCIRCGYSFKARAKGANPRTILIAIVVLLIFWIAIRIITHKPILPSSIVSLFKNITSNKTG